MPTVPMWKHGAPSSQRLEGRNGQLQRVARVILCAPRLILHSSSLRSSYPIELDIPPISNIHAMHDSKAVQSFHPAS